MSRISRLHNFIPIKFKTVNSLKSKRKLITFDAFGGGHFPSSSLNKTLYKIRYKSTSKPHLEKYEFKFVLFFFI